MATRFQKFGGEATRIIRIEPSRRRFDGFHEQLPMRAQANVGEQLNDLPHGGKTSQHIDPDKHQMRHDPNFTNQRNSQNPLSPELTRGRSRLQLSAMQADNQTAPEAEAPVENPEIAKENATPEAAAELDPWEQLEAEAAKWKDLSLRTAAEMDNLRKRTAREREEAVRYSNQRLLEELLPVIDNFEMGMQAAAQDTSSMIYIGMDMVRRQLNEFLSSQGVEELAASGAFDPNLHDAVAQEESADIKDGDIIRVTRRGFKLRDRLLRPASVVVSKAPAAAEGGAD